MYPENMFKLCFSMGILFCIGFLLNLLKDYAFYSTTLHSAPFSLFIIANALFLLMPGILFLAAARILRRKLFLEPLQDEMD